MENVTQDQLENDIKLLKFPDNVRRRPGMYIGATDTPDVILREVIDNSLDELLLPNSTDTVRIDVDKESGVSIVGDNGRGIPNEIDSELGISKIEMATSYLHAGGKFKEGKLASIGMNGIGQKATNALSETFEIWSLGKYLKYNRGIKVDEQDYPSGNIPESFGLPKEYNTLSTVTRFLPDSEIFDSIIPTIPEDQFKYTKLICHELGKDGVHFIVNGVENDESITLPRFKAHYGDIYDDGLEHKYPYDIYVYYDWEIGKMDTQMDGTVNGVHTPNGFHIRWAFNQLSDYLSTKLGIPDRNLIKFGLRMFVVVIASEVSFNSQTKENLSQIKGFDGFKCLTQYKSDIDSVLKSNKEFFNKLKESVNIYINSAKKAQEIREINNLLKGTMNLNAKKQDRVKSKLSATSVRDCSTKDRSKAELYLVEGRSAAGPLIKARDPRIHSILPLRGRPLSAFKYGYDVILRNNEWLNIVLTIGGGIDQVHDLRKVRYGKIIINSDADPDGNAIAISLLGGFATHMSYLIRAGLVYVLMTPLYLDTRTNTYYYQGEESKVDFGSGCIIRFKGLGEFNASQFKDFAFNPDKRKLIKITEDNLEDALDLMRYTGPKKDLMESVGYIAPEITEDTLGSIKLESAIDD
jgi:DNA gyrase subunit B